MRPECGLWTHAEPGLTMQVPKTVGLHGRDHP